MGCPWEDAVLRAFPEGFRRDLVELVRGSREPRKKTPEIEQILSWTDRAELRHADGVGQMDLKPPTSASS